MGAYQNLVLLMGNVGADPEVSQVNGTTVAKFSLATTKRYKDKTGQVKEDTQWHRINVWGVTAEKVVAPYVKKGSTIQVTGELRYGKYTDDKGVDRYTTDITAHSIQLLDKRPDNTPAEPPTEHQDSDPFGSPPNNDLS